MHVYVLFLERCPVNRVVLIGSSVSFRKICKGGTIQVKGVINAFQGGLTFFKWGQVPPRKPCPKCVLIRGVPQLDDQFSLPTHLYSHDILDYFIDVMLILAITAVPRLKEIKFEEYPTPAPPSLIRPTPLPSSPSPITARRLSEDSPSQLSPALSRTQPPLITSTNAERQYSPSDVYVQALIV